MIGRLQDLEKPGVLGPGEFTLQWSKRPSIKEEFKQNSRELRREMRNGRPIRDASPTDKEGIFLNFERDQLEYREWKYDADTTLWMPPR